MVHAESDYSKNTFSNTAKKKWQANGRHLENFPASVHLCVSAATRLKICETLAGMRNKFAVGLGILFYFSPKDRIIQERAHMPTSDTQFFPLLAWTRTFLTTSKIVRDWSRYRLRRQTTYAS